MEVQTAQTPSGSSSSSAAYPRWVILEWRCENKVDGSSCPTAVAKKTLAAARTSNGLPIQISLSLHEPPATSAVLVKFPDGVCPEHCIVVAAHGRSLLIEVNIDEQKDYAESTFDYFVYNVVDAAADPPRPPTLMLLPPYYLSESEVSRYLRWRSDPRNRRRDLLTDRTGILCRRRGEDDEVVVAELQMVAASEDTPRTAEVAELLLFSSGDCEWNVKRLRIWEGDDEDELVELSSHWNTTSVFPVGDTTLCWADTSDGGGILFYDVVEESPWLHYVPLPATVPSSSCDRRVCAPAGGGTLKFVNIFPRCCCGGAGDSYCKRSRHAYTINTWTLRMDDGMEWVMDGMVDATELWSLDTYKGIPRVPLRDPLVSVYEPHVICFSLCESYHVRHSDGTTVWLLMVDLRSKTILSVSRHPDGLFASDLRTSNVSNYLNPYPTCSSGGDGASTGQSHTGQMDIEKKKRDADDNGMNWMEPAAQASEILAAFQEIPSYGLVHSDMLKAFLILSGDNGCRVRSLLRLPKNLRKDWLLMEIKADDSY